MASMPWFQNTKYVMVLKLLFFGVLKLSFLGVLKLSFLGVLKLSFWRVLKLLILLLDRSYKVEGTTLKFAYADQILDRSWTKVE